MTQIRNAALAALLFVGFAWVATMAPARASNPTHPAAVYSSLDRVLWIVVGLSVQVCFTPTVTYDSSTGVYVISKQRVTRGCLVGTPTHFVAAAISFSVPSVPLTVRIQMPGGSPETYRVGISYSSP